MKSFKMLKSLTVVTATCLLALPLGARGRSSETNPTPASSATRESGQEHRLRLYHTHTGERIDIIYRTGNQYLSEALGKLDYFLRDHRTGDVRHYDPQLFDLLADLVSEVGHPGSEIDIICGYRTPHSNEFLRTRRAHTGVAAHSLHMQAQAIDIRVPGVPTAVLRDAALRLGRGGVGYYPGSEFVHVDTGRVRHW